MLRSWLLVVLVGCVSTILISNYIDRQRQKSVQAGLAADVSKRTQLIEKEFSCIRMTLEDLASAHTVQPDLSRDQFARLVSPIFSREGPFSAISWNPRIKDVNRASFERRARKSGITDFTVRERSGSGELIPAGKRDEYVSVLFIEPKRENRKAVGFDIASESSRRAAIQFARQSRSLAVTSPIKLVQDSGNQYSLLAFFPTFKSSSAPNITKHDGSEFTGVIVGVVKINKMIADAIGRLNNSAYSMQIVDSTDANTPLHLYASESPLMGSGRHVLTSRFSWGGRDWKINFEPTTDYLGSKQGKSKWIFMCVGFLLTFAFSALVFLENSKRHVVHRVLREEEERLRLALDSVADGWWDWNVSTDQVQYSASCAKVLSFPVDENRGFEAWREVFSPQEFQRRECSLQKCLSTSGNEYNFELKIGTNDCGPRWIVERGRVVSWNREGQVTRMVGTIWDVTQQKAAQEQKEVFDKKLRETQKLESLGLLAGGIAHDFNNYLASILGNSELAEAYIDDAEKLECALKEIRVATAKSADLTSQMLAYAGMGKIKIENVDLNKLVGEMRDLLQTAVPKGVSIRLMFKEKATVLGDSSQIAQIVMNLITNAAAAVGSNGTITISANVVTIDDSNRPDASIGDGKFSILKVTDNGSGMKPEVASKVFEPFFTTKNEGHGLGLAAVHGIVRRHHGFIDLQSIENQGTTAIVYLPSGGPVIEKTENLNSETPTVSATKILVIDDEPSVRDCVRQFLEFAGYEALTADSGETGFDLFLQHKHEIGLSLIDMTMPNGCGITTFERIHEVDNRARCIIMSGFSRTPLPSGSAKTGIVGFLRKPFRSKQLIQDVERALSIQIENAKT